MSWKNIKNFLIILFIIINAYLIFSANGFEFHSPDKTYTNNDALSNAISVIKNNYNVTLDKDTVPQNFKNLGIINVTNILYTEKFKNSGYNFKTKGASFEAEIKTDTFSYNETNAREQITQILHNMGIAKESYTTDIVKSDKGVVCTVREQLSPYPIFNGKINALFAPSKITLDGTWYISEESKADNEQSANKMSDITGVIVEMASAAVNSDGTKIKNIDYGYFVSTYDENTVSKSSSAIPCYLLETDEGSKYYYDALNGKPLKQED